MANLYHFHFRMVQVKNKPKLRLFYLCYFVTKPLVQKFDFLLLLCWRELCYKKTNQETFSLDVWMGIFDDSLLVSVK